jgi:hypothetical protein
MKLIKVRQKFNCTSIKDIESHVTDQLSTADLPLKPGARIAVAIGSRGINHLVPIVKTIIRFLKSRDVNPFIVPAMGSHGNANAEGQRQVLKKLEISEEDLAVPILSSMEVVAIPAKQVTNRVFMDRHAYEADGVILINRIKPHTDFHGPYESGLVKMAVIGLGKHKQALEIHRFGVKGLQELLPATAAEIFDTGKIILGLAIVENACDTPMVIKALRPDRILSEEPDLLKTARENMPSLPVPDIDVLIVDRMGKDISGTGMDPNITGRMAIRGYPDPPTPRIKTILVDDLTYGAQGNASGVGFADVITRKLYDKIDFAATYENVLTAAFLERGKIPVVTDNARQGFDILCRIAGPLVTGKERVIRIRDTLHLEELFVSAAIYEEIKSAVERLADAVEMFSPSGELEDFG